MCKFEHLKKSEKSLSIEWQVTKTHCKKSLQGLPDFVGLLMDGLCNTGVVGDIRIPHSGALEQEQASEGCSVHKWKGLVHESNFRVHYMDELHCITWSSTMTISMMCSIKPSFNHRGAFGIVHPSSDPCFMIPSPVFVTALMMRLFGSTCSLWHPAKYCALWVLQCLKSVIRYWFQVFKSCIATWGYVCNK